MLQFLPCLDSSEMAAARQRDLNIPRDRATRLGITAVAAARDGFYRTASGGRVDWRNLVQAACEQSRSIAPASDLPLPAPRSFPATQVQVANETTLGAARRLVENGSRPIALNFANGVVPGGGFLIGATAQEETLCRSSALYVTLEDDPMYFEHRRRPTQDSTDWTIYSPEVPVFRQDDGTELPAPWLLSFLTCAAPLAMDVGQPLAGDLLRQRLRRVLAIAEAYGYSALVLGAWGCGAFGNDPVRTASDFRDALENDFSGAFADVVFAVTDWSPERRFLGPFRDAFRSTATGGA